MKRIYLFIFILLGLILGSILFNPLRPSGKDSKQEVVMIDSDSPDAAAISLEDKGMIRSFTAFNIAYKIFGKDKIKPGGYYISKNMSALKIIKELNNGPDLNHYS